MNAVNTSTRGQGLLHARVIVVLLAIGLLLPVVCGTAHAKGGAQRAAKCATKGDAKVSKGIAKKMVAHAIMKYSIADLVDEQAIKNARTEVYEFLKWKLGNPSAICGQYVTAGQKHFNKAYGDEAAAALLGFDLPNEKAGHSEFFLPPALLDLKLMLDKNVGAKIGAAFLEVWGIPSYISEPILKAIAEQETKIEKRMGFNIPKKYDFPNGLVQLTIEARRDPQKTRAKLQQGIDEAVKKAQSQGG